MIHRPRRETLIERIFREVNGRKMSAALKRTTPGDASTGVALTVASLPLWPGAVVRVHRTFTPAALGPGSLGGTSQP